jgi:hypothetical protein
VDGVRKNSRKMTEAEEEENKIEQEVNNKIEIRWRQGRDNRKMVTEQKSYRRRCKC